MAATKKTTVKQTTPATREGDAKCPACRKAQPVTKFPTVHVGEGVYERDTRECRACRDKRRAEKAAARKAKA